MSGLVHQETSHAVHGKDPDPNQDEENKTQCCPEMELHRSCTVLGCQSEPDPDLEREYDPKNLNISFAGCGFLGIYHLGVAAAFSHFLPDCQYDKLCGASAGALAATGLVAGIPVTKMVTTLLEVAGEARRHFGGALNPSYNITDVLFEKLRQILPEDIHIRANGKLFVSVTKIMDGKNVMIENYMNREELIEAIVASAFIPGFSGAMPPVFRGCRIIDGGFSCNLPDIFENTITVSPFAGSAIICPLDDGKVRAYPVHRLHFSDQGTDVTFANAIRLKHVMYPPSLEELNKILMAGFKDGHRFLRTEGFIKCTQCLTIRSEMTACEDLITCDEFEDSLPQALSHTFESFRNRAENLLLHSSKRFSLFNKTCRLVFNVASYTPPVYLMKKSLQVAQGTTVLLAKTFLALVNMMEVLVDIQVQSEVEKYLGHTLKAVIKDDDWISVSAPKGSRPVKKRVPKRSVSMDINISQFGKGDDDDNDDDDYCSGGSAVAAGGNDDGVDLVQIRVENIVNDGKPDPTTDEEARQLQADNLLNATRSENISRSVSRLGSRIASKRNSLQSSRQHSRTGSRCDLNASENVSVPFLNASDGLSDSSETLDIDEEDDTTYEIVGPLFPGGKVFYKNISKKDVAMPLRRYNHDVITWYHPVDAHREEGYRSFYEALVSLYHLSQTGLGPQGHHMPFELSSEMNKYRSNWALHLKAEQESPTPLASEA